MANLLSHTHTHTNCLLICFCNWCTDDNYSSNMIKTLTYHNNLHSAL